MRSTTIRAAGGNTAQRNGTRVAHAETSRSHAYSGEYQSPWNATRCPALYQTIPESERCDETSDASRPFAARTAPLRLNITVCVATVIAHVRSGSTSIGMSAFASTVV